MPLSFRVARSVVKHVSVYRLMNYDYQVITLVSVSRLLKDVVDFIQYARLRLGDGLLAVRTILAIG